ncbi:MAG: hypothetical protein ACREL6_01250, partial [Gemmatimonadales bacterium]
NTRIRGFAVTVRNSRPGIDTDLVLSRLDEALGLIEQYTPHYFRHLQRDFSRIRYACRGAFFPADRTCMVELTFVANPAFSLAEVAATIIHEGMHARLHRLGYSLEHADRARQERFCRRAEIEFGSIVPGGEPVMHRATESLAIDDEDVAPEIDPELAARRVAEADAAARRGP